MVNRVEIGLPKSWTGWEAVWVSTNRSTNNITGQELAKCSEYMYNPTNIDNGGKNTFILSSSATTLWLHSLAFKIDNYEVDEFFFYQQS